MRFREQFGYAGPLETGQESKFSRMASSLERFGREMEPIGNRILVSSAEDEAQRADFSNPELKSDLTVYGRAYNETVLRGHQAAVKNSYTSRIKQIADENRGNPSGFAKSVQAIRGEVIREALPEIRGFVELNFDALADSHLQDIKIAHRERVEAEAIAEQNQAYQDSADNILRFIRNGRDQDAINEFTALEYSLSNDGNKTDVEKKKILDLVRLNMVEQTYLDDLEAMGTRGAFARLEALSSEVPDTHTPDEWGSFIKQARAQITLRKSMRDAQRAEIGIETKRSISNLKLAAKHGLGEPEETLRAADRFFEQGLISEGERTSIYSNVLTRAENQAEESARLDNIADVMSGDGAVYADPADQDLYYEQVMLPSFRGASESQVMAATTEFIQRTKRVPKKLKRTLSAMVKSDDPEAINRALMIIDKVDEIPGLVDDVFPKEIEAFVRNVVDLLPNMTPKEAVRMARQLTDPSSSARIEQRRAFLKDEDIDYMGKVEGMADPWGIGDADLDPLTQDQLVREYRALYDSYYVAGMDEEAATEKTERTLRRHWGEWEGRMMKFPPSLFYSVAGESDYVRSQLESDVAEDFWWADSGDSEIFLVSTEHTQRTIPEPEYQVWAIVDGAPVKVSDRWKPDVERERQRVISENREEYENRSTVRDPLGVLRVNPEEVSEKLRALY